MNFVRKFLNDTNLLLIFSGLYLFVDLFYSEFFISYLMHANTNEIMSVSLFRFFECSAIVSGFFVFAGAVKKYNKAMFLRLSAIASIILLSVVSFFDKSLVNYIVPFGIVYGLGESLLNLPYNVMVSERVADDKMVWYTGTYNIVSNAIKVLAPLVIGALITFYSYQMTARFLVGVVLLQLLVVHFFSKFPPENKSKFCFKGFIGLVKRNNILKKIALLEIIRGFSTNGILATLVTMFTVYMFDTDLNLGICTAVFALCTILMSFCFGRYGNNVKFRTIALICLCLIVPGLILFVFLPNRLTFLIYNFVFATAILLLKQLANVIITNYSRKNIIVKKYRTEYFVGQALAQYIGRFAGFILLLYLGVFGGYSLLRYFLLLVTIMLVGIIMLIINLSKTVNR